MNTRKPYSGSARSLVLAVDVGTTFSGVSYAILEPGEVPKIHGVTRFPGQEHVAGNSKIPTVLWYDTQGKMMAAGAEAETSTFLSQAEEEGWIRVDLFKLRLRPRTMHLNMNGMRLGRLPPGKTAVDVFGDFLAYLFLCTRNFITDTHANGASLWASVESDIKFVLSHPNGWEGAQQSKLRRAAIYAGLIPNTNAGKARIFFVTEGEASLHACVLNGLAADVLSDPSKPGFLIADAGGGTWDISAYSITGQNPLLIEEIAPPDCIFAGSVFVSRRARRFLEEKLKSSKYGSPEAVEHITKRFDETTKRLFRDDRSVQFISFGSPLDKDSNVGIRGGQLKLTGAEVRELFEPSIEAAFLAIKAQIDASAGVIKSVWLVGGFAANHWLFSQLQERLAPLNVTVNRPDSQTSKAVCDGAVGFYVDHHVSVRMSKAFYGVEYLRTFDPQDADHVARESTLCELPSGPKLLPDAFDCILRQGIKVKESTIFSRKYSTELTSLNILSVFEVLIWCYRGKGEIPTWIYREKEEFSTLCTVRADLSPLKGTAQAQTGKNGSTFWKIIFSVEIHFGLTEFRARIKWVDNGEIKYGPASIVYNERGRRAEEDEPDMHPEDDMQSISDSVRSPPPLSRPPSSLARHSHEEKTPTGTESSVPEVARLPDEFQEPKRAHSASSTGDREPSRGRQSGKSKGKGKEKEIIQEASVDSRTSSRLAETLNSVWGKDPAPAIGPSHSGTPPAQAEKAPEPPTTEAAPEAPPASQTPKVDPAEVRAEEPPVVEAAPAALTPTRTPKLDAAEIKAEEPAAVEAAPATLAEVTQTTPPAAEVEATQTPKAEIAEAALSQTPKIEETETAPKTEEVEKALEASAATQPPPAEVETAKQATTPRTPTATLEPTVPDAATESTDVSAETPTPTAEAPVVDSPLTPTPKDTAPESQPQIAEGSTATAAPEIVAPTEPAAVTELVAVAPTSPIIEQVNDVKPEDKALPNSPAEPSHEEKVTDTSETVPEQNEAATEVAAVPPSSRPASKKPTPHPTPAVKPTPLEIETTYLKPSPSMIALPLSSTNSPKTSTSPELTRTPLGSFNNAALPEPPAPAARSRSASQAVSPIAKSTDVSEDTASVSTGSKKLSKRAKKAAKAVAAKG
ncbi:heat shock protein 12A [Favolaschia claudopus]|uniref:Heat shock protein 12A n=1 Tax=Favolaschia claudopus TaxID=2862362 RepID=A0AAW0C4V5_9AGAR